MKLLFPFLLTSASCALSCSLAASSEAALPLDRLEIRADRSRPLTFPSIDEARIELSRTPGGTELIAPEQFARGRVSNVNDLFALSAGVFAQSRFGSDEARLSIRGSGLQRTFHGRGLRIVQDGVPLNLADGSFDMQAFEPLSAAYVQVWRGANALRFGASTLGGAVEFVSRTGRDGPPLLVRSEIGSFDYRRAQFAASAASDQLDAHASFTHTAQGGFRAHAHQENERLFANAGWRFSPSLETRLYLTAVTTKSELPGNLLKSELRTNPRAADPASAAQHRKRDFDLLRLASKTTLRTGTTVWDVIAAWTYKDLDHPISPVVDQLSNDPLAGASFTHVGSLGARAWRLQAGALFTQSRINAANFTNVLGRRGALTASSLNTATNLEEFIESQLALSDRLTFVAGTTAAQTRRVSQRRAGSAPSYTRTYHNLSPKLGLRFDAPDFQLYANVSRSFEPPSFSETGALAAPNRAQTATTVELGTRGGRGSARWDLSLYQAQLRDEFLSLNDPAGTPLGTINADRTVHRGVEFSAEFDLFNPAAVTPIDPAAPRLMLRGAWLWSRFRFDDDRTYRHNTLAGFPPHVVRAELTWETARGWYAGPHCEWVPQRAPVDHANTLFADPYALCSFRLGRRTARGLSFFAEIRNASDRSYAATTGVIADARGQDQRQFLPGDGRSFYTGAEYRW